MLLTLRVVGLGSSAAMRRTFKVTPITLGLNQLEALPEPVDEFVGPTGALQAADPLRSELLPVDSRIL